MLDATIRVRNYSSAFLRIALPDCNSSLVLVSLVGFAKKDSILNKNNLKCTLLGINQNECL